MDNPFYSKLEICVCNKISPTLPKYPLRIQFNNDNFLTSQKIVLTITGRQN